MLYLFSSLAKKSPVLSPHKQGVFFASGIKQPIATEIFIDDYAKDGGEELFTKMHRVLSSNYYRIVKDS